jgi:hypothetical protein
MVYLLDEGSVFDAPLERIWKYLQSQDEHDHKSIKVLGMEPQGENVVLQTIEADLGNGLKVRSKLKLTMHPPFGFFMEYLEGPMTGTRAFQYYVPKGDRTGVTVVGDFVGKGMDDESVKHTALQFLQLAFDEDNANLKKLVVTA